jgi:hypothetical protein
MVSYLTAYGNFAKVIYEVCVMSIVSFMQGKQLIGVLMPSGNLYTIQPYTRLLAEYGRYIQLVKQVVLANLASDCTQTVDLNDHAQVEAYKNQ